MSNLPRLRLRHGHSRRYRNPCRRGGASVLAWAVLLLSLAPLVLGAQGESDPNHPRVTAVRFWSLGDTTRIAIESTGEFHFRSDRLDNPERIFFDLVGTKPQLSGPPKGQNVIVVGDRLLRQIRVAETQRGITRVVLDLVSDVEFTTSQLANPDRLIIELHPIGRGEWKSEEARSGSPVEPVAERTASVPQRPEPRKAQLDFSFLAQRREEQLRLAQPILIDPPSPFDPGARFSTRQMIPYDPWFALRVPAVAAVPFTVRSNRVMPGTLARRTEPVPTQVAMADPVRESEVSMPVASVGPASGKMSVTAAPEAIGLPAKRSAQGDTMTRVLGLKLGRVVIDPGHGGHDAGTTGPEGLHEKDVALDVAKRLGALIEERLGSEVVFTRTDDTFIPLSRRTEIANEVKADLFLSIHVNSSPVKSVGGVETYYLNFTTSKSALDTAMRENAGADRNVGELQDLLKKIALKDKVDESREFASRIQTSLSTLEPKSSKTTRDRGVKRAPFVVLIGASMPSVLAEVGFISNAHDENLMRKPEYRQRIAEALYRGVSAYANSLSHFQVAQQSGKLAKTEVAPQE